MSAIKLDYIVLFPFLREVHGSPPVMRPPGLPGMPSDGISSNTAASGLPEV